MSDITNKPQRLASAVYLLTSFFNDQEPLKWRLRSLSGHLVSLSMSFSGLSSRESGSLGLEIQKVTSEILALIGVARDAGLISPDNYSLINFEFSKFSEALLVPEGLSREGGRAFLSPEFFTPNSKPSLSKDVFEIEKKIIKSGEQDEQLISGSNDKRNIPDDKAKSLIPTTTIILPKNELIQESKEVLPNSEPLKKFGAVSVKKNSRQSIIISLLKRKKEIMIKDVSPLINGCSEKTIQRELLEMVSLGLLRKLGEKRWSRYTLAS